MLGSKDCDRISGHLHGRRDLGQEPAVRPLEPKRPVRLSLDPVTLLVDRAVVPTTEQREVRERGGATFGPVAYMMSFTQRQPAAREAAAAISMLKGAP